MKALINYYLLILTPVPIMAYLALNDIDPLFIISLFTYAIIYRPITDGIKLTQKGLIKGRKDYWKLFTGYAHIKWFKKLYLEK